MEVRWIKGVAWLDQEAQQLVCGFVLRGTCGSKEWMIYFLNLSVYTCHFSLHQAVVTTFVLCISHLTLQLPVYIAPKYSGAKELPLQCNLIFLSYHVLSGRAEEDGWMDGSCIKPHTHAVACLKALGWMYLFSGTYWQGKPCFILPTLSVQSVSWGFPWSSWWSHSLENTWQNHMTSGTLWAFRWI